MEHTVFAFGERFGDFKSVPYAFKDVNLAYALGPEFRGHCDGTVRHDKAELVWVLRALRKRDRRPAALCGDRIQLIIFGFWCRGQSNSITDVCPVPARAHAAVNNFSDRDITLFRNRDVDGDGPIITHLTVIVFDPELA